MYEFEEKESYTLEEVQGIVGGIKTKVDGTIADLTTQVEGVEELTKTNHDLQIKNLAITNNIDEDAIDLIFDEDLEKVQAKIDKLKAMTKEKEIDNSYKPKDKRSEDAYNKAIKNKNVEEAIGLKLGRLFG